MGEYWYRESRISKNVKGRRKIQDMKIGVDYYPEHWNRSLWEQDADRMKHAGVKLVRMAEFAWSRLEPKEGEYCFTWLDEVIGLFAEREIEVFLGTPTCTPPLWLFEKYPEVIQVDKSGHKVSIGIRGHRCLNSPVYRQKSEQIITQMVSRYVDNPWVIGYQIDNELEANHCCCPICEERFREFVKKKYGSVEKMNQAYGNNVWSGEYSSFSQLKAPLGEHPSWLNPSYMLDFNRYASESTVEYVMFQREMIHRLDKEALVTTNTWLCENMPDFYQMFEKLDFVSYDNYPATQLPKDEEALYSHAFHLDLMRGIKKKNFWIMEQLSGSLGSWMPMQPTLQPGMLKGYALQAFAHGADTVLHFRWRTAISGAEMFWHGLLDHSNVPGRRFQEFCDLCETAKEWEEIDGAILKNSIAVLYSSEQEYGFKVQPQVEGMHYFTQLKAYHDAFTCLGLGVDIVDWLSDLSEYAVVVAPTVFITNEQIVNSLDAFVRKGGRLILTNRSGVKDEWNRCIMSPLPTVFADMAGVMVKEYNPIGNIKQRLRMAEDVWGKKDFSCTLWCDVLDSKGANILAYYDEDFYQGEAAITEHSYGKGKVYYNGTVLERQGMISFARLIIKEAGIKYMEGLPLGVERTIRQKDGRSWCFFFNNTCKRQEFSFAMVKGEQYGERQQLKLAPFEMLVLEET